MTSGRSRMKYYANKQAHVLLQPFSVVIHLPSDF